jgi:PAS domain S-box-containing protein
MASGLDSLLQQTAGLSRELLFEANSVGELRIVNPAWTSLLGWNESDLLGKAFAHLVHPDDLERTREAFARAAADPSTFLLDVRCRGQDGAHRSISWKLVAHEGVVLGAGHPGGDKQVIHDVNNLMQNVVGALELVRKLLASGRLAETERFIASAIASAHRAAELNQRRGASPSAPVATNPEITAAPAKL